MRKHEPDSGIWLRCDAIVAVSQIIFPFGTKPVSACENTEPQLGTVVGLIFEIIINGKQTGSGEIYLVFRTGW